MQRLQTLERPDEQAVLERLDKDGGVIVRNYIDPELSARVRDEFRAAIENRPWSNTFDGAPDEFFGLKTKRLHGVLQYSRSAEACLTHPLALSLARSLLGEHIIMSTGELMAIGPGEKRQSFHRDGDSWHRAHQEADLLFSVNIALTDFRRENGATVVVAGSHRWAQQREPRPDELAYAEMDAGSALLYRGRTVHGGGANETNETRVGLYFGYIPSWLRPIENSALTVPIELMEEFGKETQRLLGYVKGGFITVL